ncbi:hypothetical protein BDV36DRAFT_217320 [Aspergillus pseudocaelatus]|uniref:Transmembrane protein n=1 Tax=Aspergillus pseudocaelatus TaxID=1825620 RepID=A0ABQ6WI51_9EURO|nr:hypothetical protein BDV36DRAFT_217320 [Aspergillus pseudocaelatus]
MNIIFDLVCWICGDDKMILYNEGVLDAGMLVRRVRLVGFLDSWILGFRLGSMCFFLEMNVCLICLTGVLMVGLEIRVLGVCSRLCTDYQFSFDRWWMTLRWRQCGCYITLHPLRSFVCYTVFIDPLVINPVCIFIGYYLRSVECCVSYSGNGDLSSEVIKD